MLGFSSKHHPALREMLLMHQGMPLEAHCQDDRGINKKTLETKPALEQRSSGFIQLVRMFNQLKNIRTYRASYGTP